MWAQGIHVTAYSPLGTPDSASIMKRHNDTPSLMQEPTVKKVADKLGKAPAQVTLSLSLLLMKTKPCSLEGVPSSLSTFLKCLLGQQVNHSRHNYVNLNEPQRSSKRRFA